MRLLAGNTGYGIYKEWPNEDVLINVKSIPDLHTLARFKVLLPLCCFPPLLHRDCKPHQSPRQPMMHETHAPGAAGRTSGSRQLAHCGAIPSYRSVKSSMGLPACTTTA